MYYLLQLGVLLSFITLIPLEIISEYIMCEKKQIYKLNVVKIVRPVVAIQKVHQV